MEDTSSALKMDALLAMLSDFSTEIRTLKSRLSAKETENSELKTRLLENEEELRKKKGIVEDFKAQMQEKLEEYTALASQKLQETRAELAKSQAQLGELRGVQLVVDQQLRDKNAENSDLKSKLKETEERLLASEAKLEEVRASVQKVNSTLSRQTSMKRERSPSIEFLDSPPTPNVPKKQRKVSNNVEQVPTSSRSSTQLSECPPLRKKTKIEHVLEANVPSVDVNANNKASQREQEKVVPARREEALPGNSSSSSRSSSARTPEQLAPVPGPSKNTSPQKTRELLSGSIPPSAPLLNATGSKPKEQVVKQGDPKTLLSGTAPSTSLAKPSTSASMSSKSQPKAKVLSIEASKKKGTSKIKVEEPFSLPDSDVKKYLHTCNVLPVSPPPLTLEVSRKFLRETYGGSDMTFLQTFKTNPSGTRTRRVVFPRLDLNPNIPSRPGEPGLIFASRHEILENPPWTLFVKLRNETPAVWLYLGEYKCTLSGKMTAEQFAGQGPHVQTSWGRQLLETKKVDVYVAMRARIALRKAGKLPVDDKETQETMVQEEVNAVKFNRTTLPVTVEDIVEAFVRGDEGIDIISMECVEYDHVFANDMKTQMVIYDPASHKGKQQKSPESEPKSSTKSSLTQRTRLKPSERHPQPQGCLPSASTSSSSFPQPTPESEGLRRSTRPRQTTLPLIAMFSESDFEEDLDDRQSAYDELDGDY